MPARQVTWAKTYTVELNTAPDFSGTSLVKTSSVERRRTFTFDDLLLSTTYYARLKTDVSGYGKTTSFTTKPDPATAAIASSFMGSEDQITLDMHPNPSISNFNVSLNSLNDEDASLVVTNLQGEVVLTSALKANQPIRIGDKLRQGIYIMKIIRGKEVTMKRIVKK